MKDHHTNLDQNTNQDFHAYYPPFKTRYVSNKETEDMGFLATVDEFTKTILTKFVSSREEVTNLVNNLIHFANQTIGEPTFKYEIQTLSGLGTTLVKMELTSSGERLIMSNTVHIGNNPSSPNAHAMNNSRYGSGLPGFNPYAPGTQEHFHYDAQMRRHHPHGLGQHQPGFNNSIFSGPHHENGYPYPRDPSRMYRWTPDDSEPHQSNAYEFSDEVEDEEKEELRGYFGVDDGNVSEANEAKDNDEDKEE